jgi:hypothetical protein
MFSPRRHGPRGGRDPPPRYERESPRVEREPRQVDSRPVSDPRENEYQMRILSLINEVNSIKMLFNDAESRVSKIDNSISQLPARITSIRQMNYLMQKNLEEEQLKAASMWATKGSSIKSDVTSRAATLKAEILSLESDIHASRASSYDVARLNYLSSRLNAQRSLAYNFSSMVQSELVPINNILTPIEKGLADAESTVKLTSSASYQWKEGETPIIAIQAKEMNEDLNGILTLTNQRIIFENEREIVLKKTFFIVTEKKIERQVSVEKPIGAVSKISKGNVGFFAGSGLYIDFKQDNTQLKLDTQDEDADQLIKYYNLITSGQIDDDVSKTKTERQAPTEKHIISCPYCGAPYTDEIYRGQLTVQCKYCNTRISTQ